MERQGSNRSSTFIPSLLAAQSQTLLARPGQYQFVASTADSYFALEVVQSTHF